MSSDQDLYRVEQLPVFQNLMYESESEARTCPRGDIRLVENLDTGLVHNAAFRPELMIYDARYQNEQAVSELFQKHLEAVANIVTRTMGRQGLVEIGCGKGYFLEMLSAAGVDITGFDPTYEGVNPRIERRYFEPALKVEAKGLILRHVLEHIQDPVSFLSGLKEANAGAGLVYIEVPCFDWICSRRAWFDVFYEHVNYFRLTDFERMFDRVLASGRLFGGQYLYLVADLASLKIPKYDQGHRVDFPHDFVQRLRAPNTVEQTRTAVWGGASKGVIFTLLKARLGQPIDTVIDINPAKQGKYLAATGHRVYSPADGLKTLPHGSTIFVMNSNYLEEIKQMSSNGYHYVSVDDE